MIQRFYKLTSFVLFGFVVFFYIIFIIPGFAKTYFVDVSAEAGVNGINNGTAICPGDYNADGYIDIYVVNDGQANVLYQNNGNGTFANVIDTAKVWDTGKGRAAICGDYDNDGDLDIYIVNNGRNILYQNNGDGIFTDTTVYTATGDASNGYAATWVDYDNDGDLDIYVVNDEQNILYQNNADGTFIYVSDKAGVRNTGNGRAVTCGDYDNDGDSDLYIVNDGQNVLYHNNNDGTFTEVTEYANVGDIGRGSHATFGDYDNDEYLDLYVVNVLNANVLYHNNGNGTFANVTDYAGVGGSGTGFHATFGDYDNDGDLDLYVVNWGQNALYQNNGDGTFTDITKDTGVGNTGHGNYGSFVDYDNDGDLDLYIVNYGQPNVLYQNKGAMNNWLPIKLMTRVGKRDENRQYAIGAKVTLKVGARTQHIEVNSPMPLHLGVGPAIQIDTIDIQWPSGISQTLEGISVNKPLHIVEPLLVFRDFLEPSPNAKKVSKNTKVSVTCDEPIGRLIVRGSQSGRSLEINDKPPGKITVMPEKNFAIGETVTVTLTHNRKTSPHISFPNSFNWSFKIRSEKGPVSFGSIETRLNSRRPVASYSADFDSDGDVDLAVANSDSNDISILLNKGDGRFDVKRLDVGRKITSIYAMDWDNERGMDITATNEGDILVFLNKGVASFEEPIIFTSSGHLTAICEGDFDGDGNTDIAVTDDEFNSIFILLNNGNILKFSVKGFAPKSICSGDFDGDGDIDLATANIGSDDVSILFNKGRAHSEPVQIQVRFVVVARIRVGDDPRCISCADFDGDGSLDLATANSDNVSVILNQGNGNFKEAKVFLAGNEPRSITATDIDGDGDIDLATANGGAGSGNISVLLNSGTGEFDEYHTFPINGKAPNGILAADFDRDGDMDFVTVNELSDDVSLILNIEPPHIKDINPNTGKLEGGETITITGSGFIKKGGVFPDSTKVIIGNSLAPVVDISDDKITVITPKGKSCSNNVKVINPDKQGDTKENGFTYYTSFKVKEINPPSAPFSLNQQILAEISGEGFADGVEVKIGDEKATVMDVKPNLIIIIIPQAKEPGVKNVIVTHPCGEKYEIPNGFSYYKKPVVTNVFPNYGPLVGGKRITIEGENFFNEYGKLRVRIGENYATPIIIETDKIEAITPISKTEGRKKVIVINPDKQDSDSADSPYFNYVAGSDEAYNYPNPFSASRGTTFRYVTNDKIKQMTVTIYNLAGLIIDILQGTNTELKWENEKVRSLNPGLYVAVIEIELPNKTRKIQKRILEVYR